jgi:hypothetical protein
MLCGEEALTLNRAIVMVLALAAVIVAVWMGWRSFKATSESQGPTTPVIEKLPASVTNRTFDPTAPLPPDMPPLTEGELAVTDSNFTANALVSAETHSLDSTHASMTISGVKVSLGLTVNVWTPTGASDHVVEHEDGHRQISEYFYKTAEQVAARITAKYIGRQVPVSGTDLNVEITKMLQQMGAEITAEYDKELNPEAIQLRYDAITDHARNEVSAKDAVAQAIRETGKQ